jgi:hypothetical protein
MTSLLDRFTGTDDIEDTPMTTPRQGYRPVSSVPWWAGVPGLDPAVPVGDWDVAARYTALACAVHVSGTDAVYRTTLIGRKGVALVARFRSWLLEATEPAGAARRRFALRLAVEQAGNLKADDLLEVAQAFHDALRPE